MTFHSNGKDVLVVPLKPAHTGGDLTVRNLALGWSLIFAGRGIILRKHGDRLNEPHVTGSESKRYDDTLGSRSLVTKE